MNRRRFLKTSGSLALVSPTVSFHAKDKPKGILVNDVHSGLNPTRVRQVETVESLKGLQQVIRRASRKGAKVSIAGGRHAMGAQQFGTDSVLLDTRSLGRILDFDRERGLVKVEAGIQWPALVNGLLKDQRNDKRQWGIRQKQTGGDRLSMGGTLAANAHGRGLKMKPFVGDVEAFELVNAKGELLTCDRKENPELFKLAIGGYGLLGMIYSVTLRLAPRQKMRRVVEVIELEDFLPAIEKRVKDGFTFGDFQYDIDEKSDTFMRRGVFSCYRPVADDIPVPEVQRELGREDWLKMLLLAYVDRKKVFDAYAGYYLTTNGQTYWSDTHQMSLYIDEYRKFIDQNLVRKTPSSLMISELYAPREKLTEFMLAAREILRKHKTPVIYGTIRLIEKDDETFLPWAKDRYACVIFN
ncbi:MAG: FAD-binding oxidoreductase, partial [Opitutales bacterium]